MGLSARVHTCSAKGLCRYPRKWTKVLRCASRRIFFFSRVREDAREVGTRVYRGPCCVRVFAYCVPEDASQVKHDTRAYRPGPRVNTCGCVLPPGTEGAGPRADG